MTREDIIQMAREAGIFLERFAQLVAAVEREACANELDEISIEAKNVAPNGYVWKTIKECAEVIRARGQQ